MTGPHVRAAGPSALLVELADLQQVHDYYAEAQRRRQTGQLPSQVELVPAARTLLIDGVEDPARLARDVRTWRPGPATAAESRERDVPTRYNGPDLAEVAELWGLTVAEAIDAHASIRHEVAFVGFSPGFAYINGLPAELRVPRRSAPRTRVPTGSVALADQFTGIYPRESPGGWQLIGHTVVPMWDPSAEPAAYLLPGDRVRFVPIHP